MCTSFPCKINKNWGAERPGTARCVGLVSNSIDSRVTAETVPTARWLVCKGGAFFFLFCFVCYDGLLYEQKTTNYNTCRQCEHSSCMQCLSCVVSAVSSSFVVPRHDPILSLGLGLATRDYLSVLYSTFATASNR